MEGETTTLGRQAASIAQMQEAVQGVLYFRDHYFEHHSLSHASSKKEDLDNEIAKASELLDSSQGLFTNKAEFFALKGKLLNISPAFSPEARDLLSKAVKLDPTLFEAWNDLGECYWKNNEIQAAYDCFMGANDHVKNKVSLRSLSMVMRQLGSRMDEKAQKIQESICVAKEALKLDIRDGTSWLILGNAYLSLFFANHQNPQSLKQCMSAYSQAERDSIANCNPDLHFNRAVAYKYQEEYQLSIIGLQRAILLDPCWSEPKTKLDDLVQYLETVSDLIQTKGSIKAKKVKAYAESLNKPSLFVNISENNSSAKGKSTPIRQTFVADLKLGSNIEQAILGKVLCILTVNDPVPFTFCMVDAHETVVSVTVYNMAAGCGPRVGDSLYIPEPFVLDVCVQHLEKNINYRNIRVDSPLVMIVNGKKMSADKQAPTSLSSTVLSE